MANWPDEATTLDEMLAEIARRGVTHEGVLAAMRRAPRDQFVPERMRSRAFADCALPYRSGQTVSQPLIVAAMTAALDPQPGERVLEIGFGAGYQTAVLAAMGCEVVAIERQPEFLDEARDRLVSLGLNDRVTWREGDGCLGAPDLAPFDGVLVAAAAPTAPRPLREQTAEGGRIVIPLGSRHEQDLVVLTRRGDGWERTSLMPCRFVPLIGEDAFDEAD